MLNENENKEHENNIENKNFKPKIIRNNIEKDEEKNINSNLSSGLTKVSNTIEQNNQEEDSIISPTNNLHLVKYLDKTFLSFFVINDFTKYLSNCLCSSFSSSFFISLLHL